ncbi:MAG: FMN-binding protein, partial [Flavobacteriales bacterium]|nr:FMN-binding protein [Flavobacteriales bacterium]
ENEFVSITVKKGGAPKGSMHSVDAISGGTITSDGVTEMIYDRVRWYLPYLNKNKPAINKPVINDTVVNDTIININLISKVDE